MSQRRTAVVETAKMVPDVGAFQEVNSIYTNLAEAGKRKDVQAIMGFVAQDAIAIGLNGVVHNRRQWEEDMEQDAASVESFDHVSYQIDKLTFRGNEATAYLTERFAGKLVKDGRKFTSKIACRDVLVKTAQGWRVKHSETIKSSQDFDGKHLTSEAHTRASSAGI